MNSNPPLEGRVQPEADRRLDEHFNHLRAALSGHSAPKELEVKLLAAFAAHQRRATQKQGPYAGLAGLLAPGAALAASAGLAAWIWLAPVATIEHAQTQLVKAAAAETPFIALQSLEQIALEPQPRLVQSTLPRMVLASYGVAVSPEVAGEMMRAQILVSASGQPLAMRFLP